MKTILTHLLPPSGPHGVRIIANDQEGHRAVVPYDARLKPADAHRRAALRLCAKMGWTGSLVQGALKRGYVFVFPNGIMGA